MAKKTELTNEIAMSIARTMSVSRFERKTYYSEKANAQSNLSGKTHYVDDDTLSCFHSKVISGRETDHGLFFTIIESVALDHGNNRRGFRYVIFDLFGTVLDRQKLDTSYSTSKAATKAMWTAIESLDAIAHYKTALAVEAERLANTAKQYRIMERALKA